MAKDLGKSRKERVKQEDPAQDSFLVEPFVLDDQVSQLAEQHGYRQKAMLLLRQLIRHPLVPDQFAQVFLPPASGEEAQKKTGEKTSAQIHPGPISNSAVPNNMPVEEDEESEEIEFGLNRKSAEEIRELLSQPGEPAHKEAVVRIEALQAVLANLRL